MTSLAEFAKMAGKVVGVTKPAATPKEAYSEIVSNQLSQRSGYLNGGFFEKSKYLFENCFQTVFGQIDPVKVMEINAFVYTQRLTTQLHLLFNPTTLSDKTNVVFSNVGVRSFILTLTDHFLIELEDATGGDFERLCRTLAKGICHHSTLDSLIPKNIQAVLTKTEDEKTVFDTLSNNSWLVTFIMIIVIGKSAIDLMLINMAAMEALSKSQNNGQ